MKYGKKSVSSGRARCGYFKRTAQMGDRFQVCGKVGLLTKLVKKMLEIKEGTVQGGEQTPAEAK